MATTWTTTVLWNDGYQSISKTNTVSDDQNLSIDVSLTANQANKRHQCNITGSRMKAYFFSFDGNCTIYVNDTSSGSPAATIQVKGGVPVFWTHDDHNSRNQLDSITITDLYITDLSAAANTGTVKFLYDPTP